MTMKGRCGASWQAAASCWPVVATVGRLLLAAGRRLAGRSSRRSEAGCYQLEVTVDDQVVATAVRDGSARSGSVVQLLSNGAAWSQLPCDGEDDGTKAGLRREHDEKVKRAGLWLLVAHRR